MKKLFSNRIIKFIRLIGFLLLVIMIYRSTCKEETPVTFNQPAEYRDAIILYSTDEGTTWSSKFILRADNADPSLRGITSMNPGNYVAAGYELERGGGAFAKSTDSGNTWLSNWIGGYKFKSIVSNRPGNLISINESAEHCYILITDNGYYNWTTALEVSGLNSLSFYDQNNGIAVGTLGQIFRSSNGGYNWSQISSPTSTELFDVNFYGQTGLAVGDLGIIIKTTDGGFTWTRLTNTNQSILKSVVFYYESYGAVAVGHNGTILRTINSGYDWTVQESGVTSQLYDVAAISNNTLLAVGYNGVILRSTNYGFDWSVQNSGTTRTLNGIYADGTGIFVVGD